jgi:hypothetical protein
MNAPPLSVSVALALALVFTVGCASHSRTEGRVVADSRDPGGPRPAPFAGHYSLLAGPGTPAVGKRHALEEGEPVGFERSPGGPVAVAGVAKDTVPFGHYRWVLEPSDEPDEVGDAVYDVAAVVRDHIGLVVTVGALPAAFVLNPGAALTAVMSCVGQK